MEEYVDFLSMEEQKSIQLKALFSRHHFQNYRKRPITRYIENLQSPLIFSTYSG